MRKMYEKVLVIQMYIQCIHFEFIGGVDLFGYCFERS